MGVRIPPEALIEEVNFFMDDNNDDKVFAPQDDEDGDLSTHVRDVDADAEAVGIKSDDQGVHPLQDAQDLNNDAAKEWES